jgi:hypothetical protein
MERLTAKSGWNWIAQGFSLFKRQLAEMSTLFLSYMLLVLMVGFVPLLGQVLPVVLIPVFAIGFMQACANVEAGKKVTPRLLAIGFKSPALRRLLMLGLCYAIAIALTVALSGLFDGGNFMSVMAGAKGVDPQEADILPGMLVAMLIYIPAGMAFWHAAALIAWHDMPVSKALFYSFFAVWRAGRAFVMYVLGWAVIGVLAPVLLTSLLAAVIGKPVVMLIILVPLSLFLTVIMYCSFYPTYLAAFGRDRLPPAV